MRKKDRRGHKPVLKPTTHKTISHAHNPQPLLHVFFQIITTIFAFVTSPHYAPAFKSIAADAGSFTTTVALLVFILEASILYLCLVHCKFPKLLPVYRILFPPIRYHRTHISHMRLDRLSNHWFSQQDPLYHLRNQRHSEHRSRIALLLAFDLGDGVDAGGDGHDPCMPNMLPLSESDCESDSDDDCDSEYDSTDTDGSGFLRHKTPSSLPLRTQPRSSFALRSIHRKGGGVRTFASETMSEPEHLDMTSDNDTTDEPIDVTLTSDEEGPQVFLPEDWIGVGKQWSDGFPTAVKRARNAERFVPPDIRDNVIPDSRISVVELLAQALPAPSHLPAGPDGYHAIYSEEPASTGTSVSHGSWHNMLTSAVRYLPDLRPSFNNAWLSGAISIRFPHLPYLFPLWTENLLFDVNMYVGKRRRWQDATDWIVQQTGVAADDLINACRDMLQIIPWDAAVPGLSPSLHLTSQDLALFLGPRWLNDDMINSGTNYILQRLKPGSRVRILNCLFIQALTNARAKMTTYIPAAFSPIERAIRAGAVDIVWFPLHVDGNHWTLVKINLITRTIMHADSLYGLPRLQEMALIQWWLNSLVPGSENFRIVEPDFPYPRQQDGHSCGIIVLSILASILLKYDSWTPARAQCQRMDWFLRLSETFADDEEDLEDFDDDSDFPGFPDPHNNATTPEPTDYESSRALSSDYDSCRPDSPVPQAMDTTPDGVAADLPLQLEDVDLFSLAPADPPSPLALPSHSKLHPSQPDWVFIRKQYDDHYDISDEDDSDSHESKTRRRRRRVPSTTGPKAGSSWAIQKELKAASKNSDFRPNVSRLDTFRAKVLADDSKAEFDDNAVRRVRCSHCAHWLEMRALYDLARWKEHRATPKCTKARSKGLSTQSLFTLGFKKLPKGSTTVAQTPPQVVPTIINLPCPGLTAESNEDIARYLARTAVPGGGAPSRNRLTTQLFPSEGLYKLLDSDQQRMVLRRELSLQQWKLVRSVGAVFSTQCLHNVPTIDGQTVQPCSECQSLHKVHTFQVAIHRPMPDEKQLKYVPAVYRDQDLGTLFLKHRGLRELVELDDGRSSWLKFAVGCTDGTYNSDTLTGMVRALVIKQTRLQQGKSLKNMTYDAEFSQFCDLLASTSPKAYETFQKQFGGPGLRSQRQKRAKLPKFQPDISALNVSRAANVLKKLDYNGPVSLAWDDTALEAALSVYQKSKDICLILGSIDGAITVTENDDLEALFAEAQLRKADKLRVYLLSIPLPKIPPILIAAIARGSTVTAKDLSEMHFKIMNVLHEYGIHPISMCSDGAEVERATQRIIADSAPSFRRYVILNSTPGCQIELRIPLYFGQHPTIMQQDSKHGLKTARNQIHTGARILVLAFFVILFAHLRELAINIAGPLFTRDVEKVDKQDDRAAARVFSSSTLEFLFKYHPDHVGLGVYLFVLGELVDAWQNRNITHRDRAKMVLRARFFLMAWRAHIVAHPDYSLKTQFISRESYDIFLTLCDGLISLMIAYRQFYPLYPLLPWLHSTEACEHLFGMLRQLKKDFTYSDVLNLERKLRVLQMGAFGDLSPEQQANQTASGYHHTYFKADDLDLLALMQWPTDQELADASKYGLAEASQLLKLLGINAEAMLRDYKDPEPTVTSRSANTPRSRPPGTFLELLALYESAPLKSTRDEEIFETCEMAIAADSVDKSLAITALPDSTEVSIEQLRINIRQFTIHSPPVHLESEDYALPLTVENKLNHDLLVSERARHQTKSTAKAVRQHGRLSTVMANRSEPGSEAAAVRGPSLREKLIQKLASVVPASETFNKTTGVARYVRHAGTFGGTGVPANARTENKATVQKVAASKFVAHRAKAFAGFQWVHDNMYLANITEINPIKPGDFFLGLKPGPMPAELVLCEVITLYTKSTHHDWIPYASSVGSPSYIYASVYHPLSSKLFTSMSCPSLGCGTKLQFPRTHVIFSLASFATTIGRQDVKTPEGHPHTLVTLCAKTEELFESLRPHQGSLLSAVKELTRMVKGKGDGDALSSVDTALAQEEEEEEDDFEIID